MASREAEAGIAPTRAVTADSPESNPRMQLNIVRPFMPDLAAISAEFAQCLQTGMVTNNSPHVRRLDEPQFPAASKPGGLCANRDLPC